MASLTTRSVPLAPEVDSLVGLERNHRDGLIAVATVAGLSLISSTTLFLHLTVKLVRWHIRHRRRRKTEKERASAPSPFVDLTLGLAPRHFQRRGKVVLGDEEDARDESGARPEGPVSRRAEPEKPPSREPNQFLVLLYNLLLADIHQSMAFFLNAVWLGRDGIYVGTTTCWAQGWFVSTGDLSASLFITAIAVHTWLVGIKGWKPSQLSLIVTCILIWTFNYLMVVVGFVASNGGASGGGFYVRAAAWCWVNEEYDNIRLLTHYLFIFIALALTSAIYTAIFLHLRRRGESIFPTESRPTAFTTKTSIDTSRRPSQAPVALHGGYNSAFLIYPVIYVFCTSPLAIGRIVTMAGITVSTAYFCTAGALIASNGFLDVLLWSSTRRGVVFGDVDEQADALGLDTFTFMRTPHGRKYGNMVWVEGAGAGGAGGARRESTKGTGHDAGAPTRNGRRPPLWRRVLLRSHRRGAPSEGGRARGQRTVSQESLRGAGAGAGRGDVMPMGGIQMDLITTVVVEVDPDSKDGRGGRGLSVSVEDYIGRSGAGPPDSTNGTIHGSSGHSLDGSEKALNMNMDILSRP